MHTDVVIVVQVHDNRVIATFTGPEWKRELAGMLARGESVAWDDLERRGFRWAA